MPSGKYYMPWSSNVTKSEANRDERERERMESAASELRAWVENGEGDPCDMFLCWNCPEFVMTPFQQALVNKMYLAAICIKEGTWSPFLTESDHVQNQKIYQDSLWRLLRDISLMDERN